MESIRDVAWERPLVEPVRDREVEARFRAETGRPGSMMRYAVGSDWLCDAIIRFSVQVNTHVALAPDLADQVGLVVSRDNSCRYCFGAQRLFMRTLGMDEERIQQLEHALRLRDHGPREERALAFARRLSRSQPLVRPEEMEALLQAGFEPLEAAELVGHVGLHLFFNRVSTLAALPPRALEALPDRWWAPLAQPLLRRWMLRMRRRARPVPLRARGDEPFAEVVALFDGLPLAQDLRDALDRCFESRVLSPFATPLAFAIVGRALGCPASEQEATGILRRRGMEAEMVEGLLTNLSAPGADPVDERVAALARETVWYEPAQVQRRCQTLREGLGREQILDLVGTVALANTVCRLASLAGCEAR